MLVDFALEAERTRGLTPEQSIYEACRLRFRPILMTTTCALLGGLPLMLSNGTGSELRQPLGYAMVGGLVVSQLLTLFTTPVIYLYMDRLSYRFARRARQPERCTRQPRRNEVDVATAPSTSLTNVADLGPGLKGHGPGCPDVGRRACRIVGSSSPHSGGTIHALQDQHEDACRTSAPTTPRSSRSPICEPM
jgi:hypothetical protein